MVRKAIWTTGLFCLLLALSSQTAKAQFGKMQGNVIGEDGKPLANALIAIDREDVKGHFELKTDKNGKFFHSGLPLGVYTVAVMQDGKKLFTLSGIRTKMSDVANVEMNLQQQRMRTEAEANGMQVGQGNKLSAEQMEAIQKAAKEREEQVQKRQELTGKFGSAKAALDAKNYDEAITGFQAAAEVDPTQHVVFAQLGEAYSGKASMSKTAAEKKDFFDKSVDAYQKALAIKPDDASYHNNYALALANAGKMDDAQTELAKAAQLDPTHAGQYWFNAGAVLVNTNHIKEAADAFRKATEADPNFADAYYQLGVTLTGMAAVDPKTGAVQPVPGTTEALQKYLAMAPTGPNAASAKSLLDTFSGTVSTSYGTPPSADKSKKK